MDVETVADDARDLAADWTRHMRDGDFAAAWRVSDAIRRAGVTLHDPTQPRHLQTVWNGTPLDGRRVLVRCYHGLGDTIQFARYLPRVRAVARELTVWAQPALLPLLGTLPGAGRLLPLHDGSPDAEFDVDVEIMELPYVFRSEVATIPRATPYLHVPPAPRASRPGGLAVGLVWSAGDWDGRRSVPPALLAPLLERPGVTVHLLQRGPALARRPAGPAVDAGSDDVLAAAAAMRALDLVISVDSMPAHLAGALGVPVWTLLHADADWRWMRGRDDSPWYPTMRLFRQARAGDWAPVIARVSSALDALASARPRAVRR